MRMRMRMRMIFDGCMLPQLIDEGVVNVGEYALVVVVSVGLSVARVPDACVCGTVDLPRAWKYTWKRSETSRRMMDGWGGLSVCVRCAGGASVCRVVQWGSKISAQTSINQ